MPKGTSTYTQDRFKREFGDTLPPQPAKVPDRNWAMFEDHILRNIGWEALSAKYPNAENGKPLSRTRAQQICNSTLDWCIKEKYRAGKRQPRSFYQNPVSREPVSV